MNKLNLCSYCFSLFELTNCLLTIKKWEEMQQEKQQEHQKQKQEQQR